MDSFVYLCLALHLWSLECQKWLFFIISVDDSKKSITVRAKYLSASEISYLTILENAMFYWALSYH